MAPSHKSIHDLEEDGRLKKEEQERQQKKRVDNKNNPQKKELRAAFNTSSFYSLLRWGYFPKLIFACFYGTSFMMAFPYFRYFISGGPVHGFSQTTATRWVLDPEKDGYTLFWPFCILTGLLLVYLVLYWMAKTKVSTILKKEEAWAKAQPFAIENYPDVLGISDNDRFEIKIYYISKMPDSKWMDDLANGLKNYDQYYRKEKERVDEIRLRYRDSGKRSGYKMYTQLHELVNHILPEIHKDYPIEKISLER